MEAKTPETAALKNWRQWKLTGWGEEERNKQIHKFSHPAQRNRIKFQWRGQEKRCEWRTKEPAFLKWRFYAYDNLGHQMRRDTDVGKDGKQKKKGMAEDEMVRWCHQCPEYKFGQILADSKRWRERTGVLCSMGLWRVGHDLATEPQQITAKKIMEVVRCQVELGFWAGRDGVTEPSNLSQRLLVWTGHLVDSHNQIQNAERMQRHPPHVQRQCINSVTHPSLNTGVQKQRVKFTHSAKHGSVKHNFYIYVYGDTQICCFIA